MRERLDDLPPLGQPDEWGGWPGPDPDRIPRRSPRIRATPYRWRDPSTIPPREWLYDRRLCRGFISTTYSAGGIGKSSLELVEAVALATGRPLLGVPVLQRCRVWVWNGEDPVEELERRVAAILLHYRISPAEVEGYLFLDSGRSSEIILGETTRTGTKLALPVFEALTETIRENRIDIASLDPFVSAHRCSENDNGAIDAVAKGLNRVAEETGCAFSLVHHVRKGMGAPGGTTVEDGRGAGALLAAARSARVLNQMTKEEAERAGVENPRLYFRADNGKANLAPPSGHSSWYRLGSVALGNGRDGLPDLSDHIAVVEPWQWPDAFTDITTADLRAAQAAVAAGGPWRENVQAKEWVGNAIGPAIRLDPSEKRGQEHIKTLLKTWIANGMFVVVTGKNEKGRDTPLIQVGRLASDDGE